jgi:hypothetical protein
MALSLSDLKGVVAYPDIFSLDTALEQGEKATGASSALGTGKVVALTEATGVWSEATSGNDTRLGVIPKLYWGKDVNTDSSAQCLVLTGARAEVYVEAGGSIPVGDRVVAGDGGTVKDWSSGNWFGVYKGHYGEGSGFGVPATDAVAGDAVRIAINTR